MPSSPSPITRIGSFQGLDLLECELRSATGVLIRVINYGAVIRDWQVPVANGTKRSVVLGFDRFEHYPEHSPFFGAIVGRMANRIGGAKWGGREGEGKRKGRKEEGPRSQSKDTLDMSKP